MDRRENESTVPRKKPYGREKEIRGYVARYGGGNSLTLMRADGLAELERK